MILFIAPNPNNAKKHEGFLQRVAAIDALFKDQDKHYSSDYDDEQLAKLMISADVIYVHSMYNADRIAECYKAFGDKIITDLHGVVPEEEGYADNQEGARVMASVEKLVFQHGRYFVAVTEVMVRHFKSKYPLSKKAKWMVLPIHADYGHDIDFGKKKSNEVVYAGGGQSWQNVDLMIDTIQTADDYHFTILTHETELFAPIKKLEKKVSIQSVAADKVVNYYKHASLGFILRNESLVNTVACPTKLVEYLAYGVVPIVISPEIGDFYALGYQYITLDDFKNKQITNDYLKSAQQQNRGVYEKLRSRTDKNKELLRNLVKEISNNKESTDNKFSPETIVANIALRRALNVSIRQDYQIEVYKKMINEYADLVERQSQHLPTTKLKKSISRLNSLRRRYR